MEDYSERQPDWQSCSEAPVPSTIGPEERYARPLWERGGAISLRTAVIGRLDPARETSGRVWPLPALPKRRDDGDRKAYHSEVPASGTPLAEVPIEVRREAVAGSSIADDVNSTSPSEMGNEFGPYEEQATSGLVGEAFSAAIGDAVVTDADSSPADVQNEGTRRAPSLLGRLQAWWRLRSSASKRREG